MSTVTDTLRRDLERLKRLFFGDAPEDGSTYGRKDGAWSAVTGLSATVTAGENITLGMLLNVQGTPGSYTAFASGATGPANAYANATVLAGAALDVLFVGAVPVWTSASITAGQNVYLAPNGQVYVSPGLKGTPTQFVGVAVSDSYAGGAGHDEVVVNLQFGESS